VPNSTKRSPHSTLNPSKPSTNSPRLNSHSEKNPHREQLATSSSYTIEENAAELELLQRYQLKKVDIDVIKSIHQSLEQLRRIDLILKRVIGHNLKIFLKNQDKIKCICSLKEAKALVPRGKSPPYRKKKN